MSAWALFHSKMVMMIGARTLTLQEFRACGAPRFCGKKDPIESNHWLAYGTNAFHLVSRKGKRSDLLPVF